MTQGSRRGQVTFFVIVGIVLIMIALGLYVVINMVTEQEQSSEVTQALQLADIRPLEEFTQSCVTYVVNDAFLKLGQQGGMLLSDIGGPVSVSGLEEDRDYMYSEEYGLNIAYAIKRHTTGVHGFAIDVPDYPTTTFPLLGGEYNPLGLFGYVSFPALHDPLDTDNLNTIKGQLKHYISERIPECTAGFTGFPGFEVSEGEIEVSIDFNNQSTQVYIEYPLDIRMRSSDSFYRLSTFDRHMDIKMLRMYWAIRDMLHEEVKDISYSMEFKEYDMIRVDRILSSPSGTHDALVIVEDTSSRLDGNPYRMHLLIKNRPPALHFIDPFILPELALGYTIDGDENDLIIIKDDSGNQIFSFKEHLDSLGPSGRHKSFYDPDDMDEHEVSFSLDLPYVVQESDTPERGNDRKYLTIYVSDGEYTDYQEIEFAVI